MIFKNTTRPNYRVSIYQLQYHSNPINTAPGQKTLSRLCSSNTPLNLVLKKIQIFYLQKCKPSILLSLFSALLYKDEMEKKALADEDIDHIPCPEEGFHDEKFRENDSEENDDDRLSNNDSPETEVPEKIKFLRETIKHCRHFISMVAVPQWQLLAMEIVGISIIGLKMEE